MALAERMAGFWQQEGASHHRYLDREPTGSLFSSWLRKLPVEFTDKRVGDMQSERDS